MQEDLIHFHFGLMLGVHLSCPKFALDLSYNKAHPGRSLVLKKLKKKKINNLHFLVQFLVYGKTE